MNCSRKIFLAVLCAPALAFAQGEKPDYCRYVQKHEAQDDVAYKPGVDVHGKPVVPADLNQNNNSIYQDIVIPVQIELLDRYNMHAPAGTELEPVVADMTIHADGRVSYNGHDLTEDAAALCGEKPAANVPPAADGQGDADDLSSSQDKGKLIEGQYP